MTESGSHVRDGATGPDRHAQPGERAHGGTGELRRERGQDAVPALEQQYPWLDRGDPPELAGQDGPGELADGTGHLDAGGTGTDHHEGQPLVARRGIVLELRRLERVQDAAANGRRVLEGLQPGGEPFPVVATEVVVTDARRQDQRVVGKVAVSAPNAAARDVEIDDFFEQHLDVRLASEDGTERRGDVGGRQHPRRHLIEERLEHVMVAAVEERHLDRGATERLRDPKAREAPADDHNSMDLVRAHRLPPLAAERSPGRLVHSDRPGARRCPVSQEDAP